MLMIIVILMMIKPKSSLLYNLSFQKSVFNFKPFINNDGNNDNYNDNDIIDNESYNDDTSIS